MPSPIYRLPPFQVDKVMLATAETIDWGLKLLGIPPLWKETQGQGINVGVLDTGIALEHPDLQPAILEARDFTRSPSAAYDAQGHGTHVSGIIAARRNAHGIVGVAPEAKIIMAKVLNDDGAGTSKDIVAGIRWAVEAGADILSMSLGSSEPDEEIHQALLHAISKGIFVITAAGNEGPELDTVGYPAGFPEMVAVGSIDRQRSSRVFPPEADKSMLLPRETRSLRAIRPAAMPSSAALPWPLRSSRAWLPSLWRNIGKWEERHLSARSKI